MSIKDFQPSVLITAGGTTEAIDNVRCMTNVSTGKTSAAIANKFLVNGWDVLYIHGVGAELPTVDGDIHCFEVKSAKDAEKIILGASPNADVIIHAMAVSDFTFDTDGDIKLDSSDSLEFVNHMRDSIKPNPKILPQIRGVNPDAYIMGFKYTVGKSAKERKEICIAQNITANINATFSNDDVEMKKTGERCGQIHSGGWCNNGTLVGRKDIANAIYNTSKSSVADIAMGVMSEVLNRSKCPDDPKVD